ncbi:MAG: hypothetical protein K2Q25_09030 [Mycobacteriaceae bacterium]|nr:hypothetical protein [Mycobacteriaceae bacterium]
MTKTDIFASFFKDIEGNPADFSASNNDAKIFQEITNQHRRLDLLTVQKKSLFSDPYWVLCLVIVALIGMGPYFVDVSAANGDEYYGSMSVQMSADAIAALTVLMAWWKTPEPTPAVPWPGTLNYPTLVLLKAYAAVDALEPSIGFGPPYEGADLKVGAEQFRTLHDQLTSAFPDISWQGLAAQSYAHAVTELRDDMQTLADMDRKLADLVKDQAAWVTHMSLGFALVKFLLTIGISVTAYDSLHKLGKFGFNLNPATQKLICRASQICAYLAAAMASGMILGLVEVANAKLDKIQDVTQAYQGLNTNAGN